MTLTAKDIPMSQHQFPKLHNAMWPGLVGKGPGSEPPIDLDTMLNLTTTAKVDGNKFEGVDIFLFDPHINIDSSDDDLKKLADKIRARGLVIGSVVAPVRSEERRVGKECRGMSPRCGEDRENENK